MDVKKKLVELLQNAPSDIMGNHGVGALADYLISNGVTVQESKLEDKKTNADRIRSMNDDELAICVYEIGYDEGWDKPEYALMWLQQPAEDNNGKEKQ